MDSTWISISNECSFIKDLLDKGVTEIRKANYSTKGLYFQAFTNLSLGFERVGKICLIIDYAFENRGNFPSHEYLKKDIGHDLKKLYTKSQEIITNRNFSFEYFHKLDSIIHQNVIEILNNFSKGDRYHNIDSILNNSSKTNPINHWRKRVDDIIWNEKISKSKKDKILTNSEIINYLVGDLTYVNFTGDDDVKIDTVQKGSFETGYFNAVSPIRQLVILQIIRYWHELLSELNYLNLEKYHLSIPYLSEFLKDYYNSDKYLKSRKKWDIN